ncbi:hypothetical protein DV096_09900 [Bradymonadaceae bacterium TMQ3]|uniref:Uncharacterized protein n=1 Tax=Lujinxingia sediminis TaxID=2480984 RepID=A0ABY0CTK1_9DELT|nr:hypothetical protein [Lujinxingia sediminis]RDV38118.1 hypothetical protein DV096_09900 [Bradymonadaceae bacterium TMQ3]RVU43681.1 hypothetical protein EA187_12720 [Lujinxingia sediminis]TXC75789.1 hypothetical protein FRC91_09805 [Bradymonadales bacterium TMQ1]
MSHLPPGQLGFIEQVQYFFTALSGRTYIPSPKDLAYLLPLKEQGAPAAAVCRGIEEAFRAYGEADRPRSVRQCWPFIEAELERLAESGMHLAPEAGEGSGSGQGAEVSSSPPPASSSQSRGESGDPELLRETLDAIEEAGRASAEERWREAYRQGWRRARELSQERGDFGFEELEAADRALIEAYWEALKAAEREELEAAIAAQLAGELRDMSPRARREHQLARRRKALIERYGLVDLLRLIGW